MSFADTGFGGINKNELFKAGDFEATLDMGKLVDDDKEGVQFRKIVSLNGLYSNFTIHQSIFDPFMTLTIHITESKTIFQKLGTRGLQGEEFVKIKFNTPGMNIIEDIFYVTGYSAVKTDPHDLATSFALKCVSKEKLINDTVTINQSFTGTTSDIAKNIFNKYIIGHKIYKKMKTAGTVWKEKSIIVDESVGTQKFIIPGLTPFKALHFLSLRSFGGSGYPGSFYSFFEAEDSFYFKNIENWSTNIKSEPYTYDSDMNTLPSHNKAFFRNIKNMSPLSIQNTMVGIQNGEYASKVMAIDFNRKSFKTTEFNMLKQRKHFNTLGKHFNMSSEFFNMFGSAGIDSQLTTNESTIVVDSTKKDFNENFSSMELKKAAYMQLLNHYMFKLVIHGDSSMKPGTVINIKLKEAGAPHNKYRGSMYSGNWYVTKCAHICDNGVFNTRLTVVKDGLDFLHSEDN